MSKSELVILLTAETQDLPLITIHLVHPHCQTKVHPPKLTVISLRYFKCGSLVSNLIAFPFPNQSYYHFSPMISTVFITVWSSDIPGGCGESLDLLKQFTHLIQLSLKQGPRTYLEECYLARFVTEVFSLRFPVYLLKPGEKKMLNITLVVQNRPKFLRF